MAQFTTSDGIRLDYAIDDFTDPWAKPPALLLLHSAMGCKDRFFAWVPALARHFRVLRLDFRGHGRSEVPAAEKPFDIPRLKADIVEFLDHAGIDKAHFVGASAGGYMAIRMAMDHARRVESLVLFGATPGFKGGQAQQWIPRIRKDGFARFLADTIDDRFPIGRCNPKLVKWFIAQAGASDPTFVPRFIALMDQQDWSAELGKIGCPTFLAIPGAGKIGDYAAFERMQRQIAGIEVVTYADAPHNIWDFEAERCAADTLGFIRRRFPGQFAG